MALVFGSCKKKTVTLFEQMLARQTSLDFVNQLTPSDSLNAFTFTNFYNGAGVGVGDFNNDSLPDLFFAGNQTSSRLFINQGEFKFQDLTESSGVATKDWCTGVSIVDINQDGWDDIYVSVAKHPAFGNSRNLLFINQRTKVPTFREQAREYGLDFDGFTIQTVFFDYDLDGDLDAFLLNTAPDLQNPTYLRPAINNGSYPSTDRLFRNNGKNESGQITFTDVSAQAGIRYEGLGLGVVVSDLNGDGYPDIYCSNDFQSSDILYLNSGNGTFTNVIADAMDHTSLFGMGVDAADLTNDGQIDILQMDMLPEDNFRQKQMLAGQEYDRKEMSISPRYQYQLQYMRNMFQVNTGTNPQTNVPEFSEIGLQAGVAKTDWSWATLLADFDLDTRKDIFITNGYRKNITDRDFITYAEEFSFFGTDQARLQKRDELLSKVPEIKLRNYAFRNASDFNFENVSESWGLDQLSYSNGAVWADLDRDGDLDLVVNTIDSQALVYRNRATELPNKNYLNVLLRGPVNNRKGLGAKITLWTAGNRQVMENWVVRGYASSVEPGFFLGTGGGQTVDSLIIQWPDQRQQRIYSVSANQRLTLDYQDADSPPTAQPEQATPLLTRVQLEGLLFEHFEDQYVDFKQTATLHKMLSRSGFALLKGDVNGDGLEDLFVGGAYRGSNSQVFLQQKSGSFNSIAFPQTSTLGEVSCGAFLDIDNDQDLDLILGFGSTERPFHVPEAYLPQVYVNDGKGNFSKALQNLLPELSVAASKILPFDFDQDGDLDVLITGRQQPGSYPKAVSSYLLRNDSKAGKVQFTDVSQQEGKVFQNLGMVCDVVATDLNQDAYPDLVLVGEWMPILLFLNDKGKGFSAYKQDALTHSSGWWNCVVAADLNGDKRPDFVLGNEGLNTFYRVSETKPAKIIGKDFNGDGKFDPIMGYYLGDKLYPAHPRDALNQQVIQYRKKYLNYGMYAKQSFEDLFTPQDYKDAYTAEAVHMESSVLLSDESGNYRLVALPPQAQQAPVFGIVPHDFNHDGHNDLMLTGNFFPNEVHMGRQDASRGLLVLGNGKGDFKALSKQESGLNIRGDMRGTLMLSTPNRTLFLTAVNSQGIVSHKVTK
ncbi:RNA-binding protein [Arundinibacter roseus]|uniref:RNA-binding protein n=2 Tax=Arundinibacter roseus TaxID=2070510 RepID=A0A4R4KKQ2_9BACT|nr:RNA-binding protein [Arundinibacter roseus]